MSPHIGGTKAARVEKAVGSLVASCLADAVRDILALRVERGNGRRRESRLTTLADLWGWIGDAGEHPFSFVWCCEIVGCDPHGLRDALHSYRGRFNPRLQEAFAELIGLPAEELFGGGCGAVYCPQIGDRGVTMSLHKPASPRKARFHLTTGDMSRAVPGRITSDEVTRLARLGIIEAKRLGHRWRFSQHSLEQLRARLDQLAVRRK